jgi:voltage-gated potassium channel Kch
VFEDIETICIAIFTVDYVMRVATSHAPSERDMVTDNAYSLRRRLSRTMWFLVQPINLVDLFAILPFYVELTMSGEGGVGSLQILRLVRICRIFKMTRHHPGVKMFAEVLYKSGQPFFILVLFLVIICLVCASLMHAAEGQHFSVHSGFTQGQWSTDANETIAAAFPDGVFVRRTRWPDTGYSPTPFRSIPVAIWWVVVTLSTVGYGDMYPTTLPGMAVAVLTFYVGILFLALPISILGSNFEAIYKEHTQTRSSLTDTVNMSTFPTPQTAVEPSFKESPLFPGGPRWGLRKRVFVFFENPSASKLGRAFSVFVMCTILAVTTSFVMESMPEFNDTPSGCDPDHMTVEDCRPVPLPVFHFIEIVGICIFTLDYVCRVFTVHAATPEECGLGNMELSKSIPGVHMTLLYCKQMLNIIDLLAIAPFYVQLGMGSKGGSAMSIIRVLRLTRVFRVLRMKKLSSGVSMFANVITDSLPALSLLLFMTFLACIFFASCMSYAEGSEYSVDDKWLEDFPLGLYVRPTIDGHDKEPTPFISITFSVWWFFVTATTVGYGDYAPTTTAGRVIGLFTVYCGIILLALPISVIGSSFSERYWDWELEMTGGPHPNLSVQDRASTNLRTSNRNSMTSCAEDGDSPKLPASPKLSRTDRTDGQ